MKFNYGIEKKKFEAEWSLLRKEYAAAGMDDAAIQAMYEYDLSMFNRRRADAKHEQPLEGLVDIHHEEVFEDRSPLLLKFECVLSSTDTYFSADRFGWIEAIDNDQLYAKLKMLNDDEKELLTLFAMDGYSKREIARMRNLTEQAVGQKLKRLRNFLFGV